MNLKILAKIASTQANYLNSSHSGRASASIAPGGQTAFAPSLCRIREIRRGHSGSRGCRRSQLCPSSSAKWVQWEQRGIEV